MKMDKTNKQTEITKCISCVRYSVIKKTYKENDKRQKKKIEISPHQNATTH